MNRAVAPLLVSLACRGADPQDPDPEERSMHGKPDTQEGAFQATEPSDKEIVLARTFAAPREIVG